MSFEATAWAWSQQIPGLTKLVLMGLANYADREHKTAYPNMRRLAADCGISIDTVKRAVKRLETKGLISHQQRYHADGGLTSNLYILSVETQGSSQQHGGDSQQTREGSSQQHGGDSQQTDQDPVTEPVNNDPVTEPVTRGGRAKRTPTLTAQEIQQLHDRYDSELTVTGVDEHIAEALAHKSSLKWTNTYIYVNGWLRREGGSAADWRGGPPQAGNRRGRPVESMDNRPYRTDFKGGAFAGVIKT